MRMGKQQNAVSSNLVVMMDDGVRWAVGVAGQRIDGFLFRHDVCHAILPGSALFPGNSFFPLVADRLAAALGGNAQALPVNLWQDPGLSCKPFSLGTGRAKKNLAATPVDREQWFSAANHAVWIRWCPSFSPWLEWTG